MTPVVLEHHLILLPKPAPCSCGEPAHWQLDESPVCTRCYLFETTDVGTSLEFRHLMGAVHGVRVEQATEEQLNHLLAIVVMSERSIQQGLKYARSAQPGPEPE